MRKYLAVFLILVVLLSLGCVLVACKPKEPPVPEGPENPTKTVMQIFDAISEQMPGGALSTDTSFRTKLGNDTYYIGFRTNNPLEMEDISKFEFAFDVRKNAIDGEIIFATYIVNSKVYIETLNGLKIFIADFDVDFLISLFKQIPDFTVVLDAILKQLPIEGIDLSTAGIIDLLIPLLFDEKPYFVNNPDGTTSLGVEIVLSRFLDSIIGLISDVGLDNEISKVLNMPISDTDTPLADFLLNDLGALIKEFPFKVMLDAVLKPGETPDINVSWKMANSGVNVLDLKIKANVYETKQNIGIPDDLTNDSWLEYSVFNLGMDLTISAKIGDANNTYLDLTSLINLFAGQYEDIIPTSVPLRLSLGEAGIKVSIQTQLNRYDNSDNMLRIELDGGFIENGDTKAPVLFGIYYIDSAFYIRINFDDSINGLFAPVIKFTGVDLAQVMDSLLGGGEIVDGIPFEGLGKMISDAILNAISSGNTEVTDSKTSYSADNSLGQTLKSSSYNAESSSGNRAMSLIYKLLGIFGFDEKLLANDKDGFGINFYNGETDKEGSFIQDLLNLVPQIKDLLGPNATESDFIKNLQGHLRFNYGAANAGDDIAKRDLANITLALNSWTGGKVNGQPTGTPIEFKLVADNFRFGEPDAEMGDYIRRQIENVDIADNLSELIANIADGAKLSAGLDIKLPAGTIDLNTLLKPLNIEGIPTLPTINIAKEINLKFSLDLQFAYNTASPSSSKMKLELILDSVTDSNGHNAADAFPYMALGVPAIGLYSIDGALYVDLSGIRIANLSLPRLKAEVDLMTLLADQLNNIDMNFTLDDILNLILGNGDTNPDSDASGLKSKNSYGGNGDNLGGVVIITKDQIAVQITSMAIMNILKEYLDLNFDLPNILLDIKLGGDKLFSIGATLKDDNFENDIFSFELYVDEFNIGRNDPDFNNSFADFDTSLYESNIIDIAKDLLGHVDISAELSMLTRGDKLDITELINNLLAITGERIDFPIIIDIANFSDKLNLILKWNLADNPRESELIFELFSENGKPTAANGYKATGFHIGFYVKNAELLLDLSQLGITKLKYVDFDVNALIDMLLDTALSGIGLDQESLDFTKILGDLLGNVLPASNPKTSTFADNYSVASYNASVNSVNIGDELVNSLLDAILKNLTLNDSTVILSLMSTVLADGTISDPIKELLYQLGIDAGVDIGAEASIDIGAGVIDLTLGLQNTEIGINLAINGIGKGGLIDWQNKDNKYWITRDESISGLPDRYKFSTFANISDAKLLDLILNAIANVTGDEQPNADYKSIATLSTKIKNGYNGGVSGGKNNVNTDYQDLTIEIVKAYREFSSDRMLFRKGDYKIILSKSGSGQGGLSALAVLKLAPYENKLYLTIKQGLADTPIVDLIDPIGIDIPLDSIGDSLPDFSIPTIGGTTKARSSNSNVYAAQSDGDAFGIDSLFDSEHGITASFGNNNDIKISADIKGAFISNMLNELLGGLFNTYMKDVNNEPFDYLDQLNRGDHNGIVENVYTKFLRPFIDKQVDASISGLLAAWKAQIKDTVARILPIPKFSDARVELNVINGAASTAKIRTYSTEQDKIDDRNSSYTGSHHNIAIDLVNSSTARKGSDTNIDWMGQSTDIIYMMDGFGNAEQEKLSSNFVKAVWGNVDNSDSSRSIQNYAMVNFNDSGYAKLKNALASKANFDAFIRDGNNDIISNEDGSYTYKFNLKTQTFNANYNSDKTKIGSLPISITLVPYMNNITVDTLRISPTDKQPTDGKLKTDVLIRYGSGDNAQKITAVKTIEKIKKNENPLPNGDIEANGVIKFLTDDKANKDGYIEVPVKLLFLSDETKKFVGSFDVVSSEKGALRGLLANHDPKNISAENAKIVTGLPRVAYFKYDSSPVWRSELVKSWDLSNVEEQINKDYFTANVVATLKNGTKVSYTMNLVSDTVTGVSFGGQMNTLSIDPLEYWNPANWKKNPLTEKLAYSKSANAVFSTVADIKYQDGRIVKETIAWDIPTLEEIFIENYEGVADLLAGRTYSNLIIKPVNTKWNNSENQFKVAIKVLDRKNPSLVFGTNESGDDIASLNMNPYDNVEKLMSRTATAVYPDGKRIEVNIKKGDGVIDLPVGGGLVYAEGVKVIPKYYDSLRVNEDAILGEYTPNASLISQTVKVPIIVDQCIINDVANSNPYMLNSISRYLFKTTISNPVNSIVELFPKSVAFTTKDLENKTFEVEYGEYYKDENESHFDNLLADYSSLNGKTITVQLRIKNADVDATNPYPYEMKITIPDRNIIDNTAQRSLSVTYEEYITRARHGISNRVTINFGQGDNIVTDTFLVNDKDENGNDKGYFNFNSIDLTKEGDNKGYVYIKLTDDLLVKMPLMVTNCPKVLPIGLAAGYDNIVFSKAEYFKNQAAGKENLNYANHTSWKLKVINESGNLITKSTSDLGASIKWEYSDIKPNVDNQTVKLKVYDANNNIIGVYDITIRFI